MNRLEEILEVKRQEIEQLRSRAAELDREARARTDFRDFRSALHRDDEVFAVIAEIKKASPSRNLSTPLRSRKITNAPARTRSRC